MTAISLKPLQHKKKPLINLALPVNVQSLNTFLKAFETDAGNISLIDKNQHTAKLSDTCLVYDANKRCTYFRPQQSILTLPFLCIALFTRIENMTLACAFFEEIPMYAINNKPRWVVNDRTALGLLKQIINDFEYVDSTQYSCIHMNYVKAILLKLRPIFWDLSIHWRTPEVLITVNNGEKQSLAQVLNAVFNELNEVRQSRKFKEEIRSHVRLSEGSFKTIQKYVTALRNANESLHMVCVDLIGDAKNGLDDANSIFRLFKHALRRTKRLDIKGYIWKLEHSFDGNFYYHCIFFLKADKSMNTSELAKNILQIWNEKIGSYSSNFNIPASGQLSHFKDLAVGSVDPSDEGTYEQLFNFIRYLCKKDQFIVHKSLSGKSTFGKGRSPSIRKH